MAPLGVQRVTGADPAAAGEILYTVPAGKILELVAVRVALVQGITQTPQPILQVTDPNDNVVFESLGATGAQPASTTATYIWGVDLGAPGALIGATPNIRAFAPLAKALCLPAGWKVKTSTLGIGAGTDYGVPSLLVIERG